MTKSALLILLCFAAVSFGQTEFSEPWRDMVRAIVIDAYEQNPIDWDLMAGDRRVVGIIHQATKGLYADKKYSERRAEALKRGYKWGSYHMGTKAAAPVEQADFYLRNARPAADDVMVLDIEDLTSMPLADAVLFIGRIKEKTGRYPVVYANHEVATAITAAQDRTSVFAKTPLWYARFKPSVTDFPRGVWSTYTLWQFSCEINCTPAHPERCLYRVPGTETDMDVSVFSGSVDELRAKWPFS